LPGFILQKAGKSQGIAEGHQSRTPSEKKALKAKHKKENRKRW